MPTKKQKTSSSSTATSSGGRGKERSNQGVDISSVHLDGQEHDDVPVYDTCDEIRKKITTHIGKQGITKAQFCRDLRAQLQSANAPANIKGSQLDRFRSNKGATAGCTSSVYYVSTQYTQVDVLLTCIRLPASSLRSVASPKVSPRVNSDRKWKASGPAVWRGTEMAITAGESCLCCFPDIDGLADRNSDVATFASAVSVLTKTSMGVSASTSSTRCRKLAMGYNWLAYGWTLVHCAISTQHNITTLRTLASSSECPPSSHP